jgi:hypothetical protein
LDQGAFKIVCVLASEPQYIQGGASRRGWLNAS